MVIIVDVHAGQGLVGLQTVLKYCGHLRQVLALVIRQNDKQTLLFKFIYDLRGYV